MTCFLFCWWLQEQRQLTHENVQRKQARTGEEREEEEEEQLSESESEDEDNEIIYNPKNLPLGWDGKVRSHGPQCFPIIPCHWNIQLNNADCGCDAVNVVLWTRNLLVTHKTILD